MVSVFAFTLTFGAGVFGMLKSGEGAVDKGQAEAAYALGYSNAGAFFRIILPQMLPHILPSYKGEIVSLIKATSVVGYIAVQDLTRMGDIVRSRTYEAFFRDYSDLLCARSHDRFPAQPDRNPSRPQAPRAAENPEGSEVR